MKIFQLIRKYLAFMGVEPFQPLQKNHSMIMIRRRLSFFTLFVLWFILSVAFLWYEVKTLDEYADAFYVTATLFNTLINLAIILWKMDSLFKLIEDFGNHFKKRNILFIFIIYLIRLNFPELNISIDMI